MKTESKSERRLIRAKDATAMVHNVQEVTLLRRFGYTDGTWSSWQTVSVKYLRGTDPVNLEDDGTMTVVASGDKLTPLVPL